MDMSTNYLGMKLRCPIVASPSPLTQFVGNIRQMEDAGVGAVVLHSLFEEQLQRESHQLDYYLSRHEESYAEALSYFPEMEEYKLGPDAYLELIRQSRNAVNIPVIASLNGVSAGGWVNYAKRIEEAGASALELNIYYIPTEADLSGAEVERMYVDLVKEVRKTIKIPLAVKLGPHFSAMVNVACQLDKAGADALVLFNRFYQPDFDLEKLEVTPNLVLSDPNELRLRLRWVAILFGRIQADMAVTGGVHSGEDALKCMMAGAKVAMMTSALLKRGIAHAGRVLAEMERWMEEHEYESVEMMQGSMSQRSVAEPAAFERANYMRVLGSYANGKG